MSDLLVTSTTGLHMFEERTNNFRLALYPNADTPVLEQASYQTYRDQQNKPVRREVVWRAVPTVIVEAEDAAG